MKKYGMFFCSHFFWWIIMMQALPIEKEERLDIMPCIYRISRINLKYLHGKTFKLVIQKIIAPKNGDWTEVTPEKMTA